MISMIFKNSSRLAVFIFVGLLLGGCVSSEKPTEDSSPVFDALSNRIEVLEGKLQASLDEQTRLRNQLEASTLDQQQLKDELTRQHAITSDLETQLEAASQKEDRLRLEIEGLQSEIVQLNLALLNLTEQVDQFDQTDAQLHEQIATLKSELAESDQKLMNSQQRLADSHIYTEQLKNELDASLNLQQQSENQLHQAIAAANEEKQRANAALAESNAEITALEDALQNLTGELQQTRTAMGSQLETQRLELANKIQSLERQITSAEIKNTDFPVQSEAEDPAEVTVFYGTNRQRLDIGFASLFSPLVIPLICIAILFLVPPSVRTFIKDHLQSRTIKLFRAIIGLSLIYFTITGVQEVTLHWQKSKNLDIQYGPGRQTGLVDGLPYELGTTVVSIPPVHQTGEVEKPELIYLEFYTDPSKHFVLSDIQPLGNGQFFDQLKQRISLSAQNDMFVFVHGFHNTFQDAAFRTAQIAYDLEFSGAPVFFSWPSQGNVLDYPTDENNVEASIQDLKHFLHNLKQNSSAQKIHLIAHSMGNRALTEAIKELGLAGDGQHLFNEVILAAPDMDAKAFRDIVPQMSLSAQRITLYASSRDRALDVSRQFHGGEHPRAGESEPYPVAIEPLESIDVSSVSGSHSYIADNGRVLTDLKALLNHSRVLDQSIADPVFVGEQDKFWRLRAANQADE